MENLSKMSISMLERQLKTSERREYKYSILEKNAGNIENRMKYRKRKNIHGREADEYFHALHNKKLDIAKDKGLIK